MNKFIFITGTILVSFILTVSTFPLGSFSPDWTQLFLIYWIIAIPMSIGLFSSWIIGVLIDVIMGSTLGINAISCIILTYFRNSIFGFLKGQNKEEQLNNDYSIKGLGVPYFSILVLVCATLYSTCYFFFSAPEWLFFWKNITRILGSSLLSTSIILSINVLFLKSYRTT